MWTLSASLTLTLGAALVACSSAGAREVQESPRRTPAQQPPPPLPAVAVVIVSIVLHGVTAAPFADRYARWFAALPTDAEPSAEARPAPEIRARRPLG